MSSLVRLLVRLLVLALFVDYTRGFICNVRKPTRLLSHGVSLTAQDYPKPAQLENTDNYRDAAVLSSRFAELRARTSSLKRKKVVIIGGGLSGLACGKYVSDAGHEAIVLEARNVLGGKVSAWKDKDGDWIETGLHIFFGAYPNMMNLFKELSIEDRLQWKRHQMNFAMQDLPGEFTSFDFIPGMPAPFHFALAILTNSKMLTWIEKLQTAPPLVPMMIEGEEYINKQDELSVTQFMLAKGLPPRLLEEIFKPMAKALDFIDPDKLSMAVVLTAMNRFINEPGGSECAFLDGNQPERLCEPLKEHIESRGGKVLLSSPVKEIVTNADGSVKHLLMRTGETIVADEYISAMPVDIFKRYVPRHWSTMPFFRQMDELKGIPVINIHMWFDRKLKNVDHLCFSRSPLLSVYADMSTTCKEYADDKKSMLELVFAPCSPIAGGTVNWIAKSDEEIIDATMGELARLFPTEVAQDGSKAKLVKYAVVKVPRSVYAAVPGRNKYRPSQRTPIPNFTLAGDWTSQKFLGSMEGAVLAGKLAAEVVAERAAGVPYSKTDKPIEQSVLERAAKAAPKDPVGVLGNGPIAWGGGASLTSNLREELKTQDPDQLVALG